MQIVVGVILVLAAMFGLANCSAPEPSPEPKFKVTWVPRPTPTATPHPATAYDPEAESTEDTDDAYVDIDHEDDGESWFCRKRRWC